MGFPNSSQTQRSVDTTSSSSEDDQNSSADTSKGKARGKNLKSGKTAKIESRIVRPQVWPHSELSMGYVSKELRYDDLSVKEFVAGSSAILLLPTISHKERKLRTEHLGSLMYLATAYDWSAVRNFHAAVLTEIERGRLNWGDSFIHLEHRTLMGFHKKATGVKDQKRPSPSGTNTTLFCREYQKGSCSHPKDHYATLKGEKKWLCHICASCWIKDKVKRSHTEYSAECPNKQSPNAD